MRPEDSFRGTARFELRRRLGAGGMGVVYEAYDRLRSAPVALKTLRSVDPGAIYRLKREFRALGDVHHPNLVTLHELINDGDRWFFTMELVRGRPFLDWVRSPGAFTEPASGDDSLRFSLRSGPVPTAPMDGASSVLEEVWGEVEAEDPDPTRELGGPAEGAPSAAPGAAAREPLDLADVVADPGFRAAFGAAFADGDEDDDDELDGADLDDPDDVFEGEAPTEAMGPPQSVLHVRRLRDALGQLAAALSALHAAGRLHRDIKPSNVLITDSGRLVLLDFGLAAELAPSGPSATEQGRLIGTPAYMAPEQATDAALTEAADWYAVGVLLYEALTGVLPFPGRGLQQIVRKQHDTPLVPTAIAPGTPEDLSRLAMSLMARAPEDRAGIDAVLAVVAPGARAASLVQVAARALARRGEGFVGREAQLAELHGAYGQSVEGKPTTVWVRGESGMGKTALVRRFLDDVRSSGDGAVILEGRCYEHELVPYKALDAFVDALSHHLRALPRVEVEALLPRDVRALTRLFPVLERVEAIAEAPSRRSAPPDPAEQRRRAFTALKELLARIADRRPLVVHIDDLQWGDADSAALLLDLVRPPEPPAMLLIGAFRREDEAHGGLLAELLGPAPELVTRPISLDRPVMITMDRLDPSESRELAARLVAEARGAAPDPDEVEAIAQEAGGHPFLLEVLARHAGKGRRAVGPPSLDEVLAQRFDVLPANARRLVEVVAVAGQPVRTAVALRAAGIGPDEEASALDVAKKSNFLRSAASEATLEPYHDRIRRVALAGLDGEALAARHRGLALALELLAPEDVDTLFQHFSACGETDAARGYALLAGDRAAQVFAFDRAAGLYFTALALIGEAPRAEERRIQARLADALAHAGRGTEAAHLFLRSAEGATAEVRLDRSRRAAEQFLYAGRFREGLAALSEVLQALGRPLAATPDEAMRRVDEQRRRLLARGLAFTPRREDQVPPEALRDLDALGAVATGLGLIDTVRGADFQLAFLLKALEVGEPRRVARALAMEVSYVAAAGAEHQTHTQRLTRAAVELAQRLRDPHVVGLAALSIGLTAHLSGDWPKARAQLERTERLLSERCHGATWELGTTRAFLLGALGYLGELRELSARTAAVISDAEARGNLFAATMARAGHGILAWLIRDQADEGERQLDAVMAEWPADAFFVPHFLAIRARVDLDLYRGRAESADARLDEAKAAFRASKLVGSQYLRIDGMWLRVRTCIALARAEATKAPGSPRVGQLLEHAEHRIRSLEAEALPWPSALALLGAGLVARARGDRARAEELLSAAAATLDARSMALYAAAARHRLGEARDDAAGRALIASADAWLRAQGVRDPARLLDMLAP